MRDHGIEAPGGLETLGGVGTFEIDTHVDPGLRRGLDEPELLVATQAYIGLLGRDLEVTSEFRKLLDQRAVSMTKIRLGP